MDLTIPPEEYQLRQEKAGLAVRQWKNEHEKEYATFCQRIEALSDEDSSLFMEMLNMMQACLPMDFIDCYNSICTEGDEISTESESNEREEDECLPFDLWNQLDTTEKLFFNEAGSDFSITGKELASACFQQTQDNLVIVPEFLDQLGTYAIENKTLLYCMYYFVLFDNGLSRMLPILGSVMQNENIDSSDLCLALDCTKMLVNNGLDMRTETKASLALAVKDCDCDIISEKTESQFRKHRGRRGRHAKLYTLDDLLINKNESIKNKIRDFLADNPESICLAYLLKALILTGYISAEVQYMPFHRAIEHFMGRKIGNDKPQARFHAIKAGLNDDTDSMKKAKRITLYWQDIFAHCV